jgi:hypothetical protein
VRILTYPKSVEEENGIVFFITVIRTILIDLTGLFIANVMPAIEEQGRESLNACVHNRVAISTT